MMDTIPYSNSLLAVTGFWILFVIVFVLFLCRLRRKQDKKDTVSETTQGRRGDDSRRVVQIYYIGNVDSTGPPTNSTDFIHKILSQMNDQPPSYEEVTSGVIDPENPPIFAVASRNSNINSHLPSVHEYHPEAGIVPGSSHHHNNNTVVLAVEHRLS